MAARFCVIAHVGEAIVLRSWPFQESDLLISLFTRTQGKVKGVAKAAMKSRRRFGGALEPMTHVRAHYVEKPKQELVRMDSFELLGSPLSEPMDYPRATGMAFLSEILEHTLVEHDPHDAVFRLTLACVKEMKPQKSVQIPVTYFALWTTRLMGWLPELDRCVQCGDALQESAWFDTDADGLFCMLHKRASSRLLGAQSMLLGHEMTRLPLARILAGHGESAGPAVELRRFLVASLERHMERKLTSTRALKRIQ